MPEVTSAISAANPRKIHIRRAAVRCASGPEAGESWLMEHDVIRIGSAKTGDIVLTDPTVSRRHAEIRRGRDGVILRDLGSTNGTWINGECLLKDAPMRIQSSDTIRFGRHVFTFYLARDFYDFLTEILPGS